MQDSLETREYTRTGEVVLTGGTILTVDPEAPTAEAVLIRGNRIAAVGSDGFVRGVAGTGAAWLDLSGRTVVPGFCDSHLHLDALGARGRALDLTGRTKREILASLVDRSANLSDNEPLVAYDWDFPSCPDPHRNDLDALFPNRPVILFQFSGHGAWVNTKGLEVLGVSDSKTEWGTGGAEKDRNGDLTGILREPAQAPRARRFYLKNDMNFARIRADIEHAMDRLTEVGVTTAHDNTWFPWKLGVIQRLNRNGGQKVRLSCWSPGFLRPLDAWFSRKRFSSDWFSRGARKYFLDGAFSSHSAWLSEPYADEPDTSGSGLTPEEIAKFVRRANRGGRQLACHSIGDRATAAYLDAVDSTDGGRARQLRHRVEHGQLIRQDDYERLARLGVVVSAQPHAAANPEKDAALLGPGRADRAYPFRSVLDSGVPLAFGSDYPGEHTFAPLIGIHLAVNRDGSEAISAEEALACYTARGAWAEFRENDKGRIKPGFLADLAVLSANPTSVDPSRIRDIAVDATMVDGRFVYLRSGTDLGRAPTAAKAEPPGAFRVSRAGYFAWTKQRRAGR